MISLEQTLKETAVKTHDFNICVFLYLGIITGNKICYSVGNKGIQIE